MVSLCLVTLMYVATEITSFVKIQLESLNCFMRFKILSMVTLKSIVF